MKYCIILILLFSISNLYSQDFNPNGARSQSLANSTGASISFWNVTNNPSATAFIENASVGIDVSNNFMINELSTATLATIIPVNNHGNLGFYLQHYGYSTFNENKFSISYSKTLSETTSASVQFSDNIQNINSQEFNSTEHEIGFNIGFFTKLSDNFHLASYYNYQKNVSVSEIENIQELSMALSWFPIPNLNVLLEVSKCTNSDISLRGGIEYKILNRIYARVGVSSNSLIMAMGIGIKFNDLDVDISVGNHQYLGMTSDISGNYIFRNN